MYLKFKSLRYHKDHAYAYDSQAFDTKAPMHDHFRMFQTYGDGLTAHSHDWGITYEYLADYLASLAVVMSENQELLDNARYAIAARPGRAAIEFAASIRWNEKKRQYYSVSEQKVSSSEAKRHDKRYFEISDVHDGSPNAIFRILVREYSDGIEKYAYASAIRDWLMEGCGYMQLPGEFLKWSKDRDDAVSLYDAYEACWHLVQAYQLRHTAIGHLNNYKRAHNIEEPAKPMDSEVEATIDEVSKQAE